MTATGRRPGAPAVIGDLWDLVDWVDESTTPVYVKVESLAVVACWLLVAAWAWWVFRR